MTLAEQLDKIRTAGATRIPPEKRAIMGAANAALRETDILDGVPKVGDTLPDFALRNAQDVEIHSAELLSAGPLVLTVFRGVW